jgi:hypothetical protein
MVETTLIAFFVWLFIQLSVKLFKYLLLICGITTEKLTRINRKLFKFIEQYNLSVGIFKLLTIHCSYVYVQIGCTMSMKIIIQLPLGTGSSKIFFDFSLGITTSNISFFLLYPDC